MRNDKKTEKAKSVFIHTGLTETQVETIRNKINMGMDVPQYCYLCKRPNN